MAFQKVVAVSEVLPGKAKPVESGGVKLLVCNIGGVFHVVESRCSHTDASLDRARIREGMILCPVHGAKFDPVSGAPRCPPAVSPLTVFAARVVDGWVEVALGETNNG